MYKEIEKVIATQEPLDFFTHKERSRGKDVSWTILVYEAHVGQLHKEWKGLKRIIQVVKLVEGQKKETLNQRYYISDLVNDNGAYYHQGIREHWGIENRLHWVKDNVHKEDHNRIRTKKGPINMSIISSLTINIHRKNGNDSITNGQIKCCFNIKETLNMIRT